MDLSSFSVEDENHLDEGASLFLYSLPPLEDIELKGYFGRKTFDAVMSRHGASLRRLSLFPIRFALMPNGFVLSSERVNDIRRHCPNIEELTSLVPRTCGTAYEVGVYRALGSLPNVTHLHLRPDCSDLPYRGAPPGLPLGNTYDEKTMVNCAFDAQLACSIFRTIAEASPQGRSRLQSLRLEPQFVGHFGRFCVFELSQILQCVSRRWLCSRNPRDDCDDVVARELGGRKGKAVELVAYESVFRKLWPDKTGVWQDDWHSFPLDKN